MKILGLTHPVSLNSAACLITDDKIVAFVEEERLNHIKHSPYYPPNKSIDYCLKNAHTTIDEIAYIAFGYDRFYNVFKANLFDNIKSFLWRVTNDPIILSKTSPTKIHQQIISGGMDYLTSYFHGLNKLPFSPYMPNIRYIRHHLAHIASAYYISNFQEACIISADGGGGQEAGMLAVGHGIDVKIVKTIPSLHSLGNLYSTVTSILGFEHHDGEGKVMGLASFGNSNTPILPFVKFQGGIAIIDSYEMGRYFAKIIPKLSSNPLSDNNITLAASLQKTIEHAYIHMGEYLYKLTGIKNFCLVGGVSLNCVANTKLLTTNFVDDLFVQPVSNDAGTALGAAVQTYVDINHRRPGFVFNSPYLGPSYTNSQIKAEIIKANLPYFKKLTSTTKTVAKLIAQGNTIGWFQGKAEVGPRALGNRSILADPSNPKMKDIINERIKGREPWRPFAPSIMKEYAKDYLIDTVNSPYMILESRVYPDKFKDLISATHVDGTVRPQTVSKSMNNKYWNLINEFQKITGVPALLNTSFNLAGEPMVCSPSDAISTFFRCGLDYLVMEDILISKKPINF